MLIWNISISLHGSIVSQPQSEHPHTYLQLDCPFIYKYIPKYVHVLHRAGWCSGKALDLYDRGAKFESRPRRFARPPESWDSKIWSWVPRDSEPLLTAGEGWQKCIRCRHRISAGTSAILTEDVRGFPQSLKESAGEVPRSRPLHSKSFPIRQSSTILPFDRI
jgi:hypothetical protein